MEEHVKAQINSTRFLITPIHHTRLLELKHKLILQDSLLINLIFFLIIKLKHKLILQDSLFRSHR